MTDATDKCYTNISKLGEDHYYLKREKSSVSVVSVSVVSAELNTSEIILANVNFHLYLFQLQQQLKLGLVIVGRQFVIQ